MNPTQMYPPVPIGREGSMQGPPEPQQMPVAPPRQQPQQPQQQANRKPPLDPKAMLWAGVLSDISGFVANPFSYQFRGLGPQQFAQAQQYNASWEQQQQQNQFANRRQDLVEKQAAKPQIFGTGAAGFYGLNDDGSVEELMAGTGPKPTAIEQKVALASRIAGTEDVTTPQWQTAFEKITGGDTNINLGGDADAEFAKASAKGIASIQQNEYDALGEVLGTVELMESRMKMLQTLSKEITSGGGKIGELGVSLRREVNSILGDDVDPQTALTDVFDAVAKELQFQRTQILKGAISDREQVSAAAQDPQIFQSPQGRAGIAVYRLGEIRKRREIAEWGQRKIGSAMSGLERTVPAQMRDSDEYRALAKKHELSYLTASEVKSGDIFLRAAFGDYDIIKEDGKDFMVLESGEVIELSEK